jgi:hypothetical protein
MKMLKNDGAPSQEFGMNLQLFAEGETSTETATETQTETNTATETQTTGTEQQTMSEQPRIKVKFNHQDMELPYEEAVTHIQKGMNYDKAVERARQEARDAVYADMGYEWNGKPITTEAEYKQALKEKEIFDKYQAQGLPEEVINELVASKRFREETLAERQTRENEEAKIKQDSEFKERKNDMYIEFLNEFKDYDTPEKWKLIPPEVFAEADKWLQSGGREGRRLADAFARYNYTKLMSQQQAATANQANAASSTGSVKGSGLPDTGFISKEVFEANKGNQQWMQKNYDNLTKSMRKWGK